MQNISSNALLRLPQVLALIPVSRSAWWAGCTALLEKLTAETEEK